MSRTDSKIRNFIRRSAVICAAAVLFGSVIPVQAAAREYDVIFRAGSNGTFGGSASITETVAGGTLMSEVSQPGGSNIEVASGYYFTGFSPAIDQNTAVTKRQVYVAQYARITNAGEYRVNYVDEKGVALATQRIVRTQAGTTVTEEAIAIDGYVPQESKKEITVAKEAAELTFTYLSTADAPVVDVVENQTQEVINNVTGSTTQAGNANAVQTPAAGTNQGTTEGTQPAGNQQNQETTTIEDQQVPTDNNPADSQVIDEEVPKGNTKLDSSQSDLWKYIGCGLAGLAVVAGAVYIIKKNKRA